MRRLHPTRPRPWWVHLLFVALLGLLIGLSLGSPGTSTETTSDNVAVAVGFAGVLLLAFLLSLLIDPYAGPLLLAVGGVIAATRPGGAFGDDTFAFTVPVAACATFYYALHVWVSARVWELSDGGRTSVDDDIRERRALVLEIGRRFLVAWTMLVLLEMLGVLVPSFGDHAETVLSAVRDAGGVVVVIDVLALAPLRIGEARRVFDEYRRRRRIAPAATVAPAATIAPETSPDLNGAWRQPPVAVSVAGLRSARARMRRYPIAVEPVVRRREPLGRHAAPRHAERETVWTARLDV